MILVFWMLSFKSAFSLSSFILINRLFSSSSLSAIRVVSSIYLRLLVFLQVILIPACASSSPEFFMMYSAYKLNKQGNNIQPWCTPFPIWNQSVVPCPVLSVASWPAYRILSKEVRCSGIPISLRIFQFVVIYIVRCFSIINQRSRSRCFLEFSCLVCGSLSVGNFISGFSAFSKSSMFIWKFSIHKLLNPSLKKFEHYLASTWNKSNFTAVWNILWHFLSSGIGMKTDLGTSQWLLLNLSARILCYSFELPEWKWQIQHAFPITPLSMPMT